PQMGLGIALGPGYEVGESSAAAAARPAGAVSTDIELGAHVRDFESMVRDRRAHAHTRLLMETEARMSREDWGRCQRSQSYSQQIVIIQTLAVMQTLQREMIPLQGLVTILQRQVTALQGQVMAIQGQVTALQGQQGPAVGPAQPELPEEAGSSS
ncbi:hypothetical protein Tco_0172314, partial [Tanacetum coccineum]